MNSSRKKILAIPGSVRKDSANIRIIKAVASMSTDIFDIEIYEQLGELPHFNPDLDADGQVAPHLVKALRDKISACDGILVCTPEYVFSLPGSLKNALEWLVSTTVLSNKPAAAITAAASGVKAQESLQLILHTLGVNASDECFVLIQGARGKITDALTFTDDEIIAKVRVLIQSFNKNIETAGEGVSNQAMK